MREVVEIVIVLLVVIKVSSMIRALLPYDPDDGYVGGDYYAD